VAPQLKQLSEADPSSINAKNIHLFDVSEGLDYSRLQPLEIQELKEWWRKAKGTVAQNVGQVQKHWGYFPRNKELDLYGFGLKSPDEGGRPRWNQKIYPRVQFEKKGWNTDSTTQQVIFEDWLRIEHNLSVSTRSHGSQPTSAAASPRLPSTSSLPRIGPTTSPLISTTAAPSVTPPREHSDDEDDNGETLDFHTPAPPNPERRADPSFELGLTTEASETTLDAGCRTPPPPDPSLPSSSDEDDIMAAQPAITLKNTAKVNAPRDFNGEVANTNNFIREVKLYKKLKPDDFSDFDGWLFWALSYMRGSKFVEAWSAAVMDEMDKATPDPTSEYSSGIGMPSSRRSRMFLEIRTNQGQPERTSRDFARRTTKQSTNFSSVSERLPVRRRVPLRTFSKSSKARSRDTSQLALPPMTQNPPLSLTGQRRPPLSNDNSRRTPPLPPSYRGGRILPNGSLLVLASRSTLVPLMALAFRSPPPPPRRLKDLRKVSPPLFPKVTGPDHLASAHPTSPLEG
jgi:hypothetical protein